MSSPRTAPGGSVGRGTPSAGVGGKVRSWGGGVGSPRTPPGVSVGSPTATGGGVLGGPVVMDPDPSGGTSTASIP